MTKAARLPLCAIALGLSALSSCGGRSSSTDAGRELAPSDTSEPASPADAAHFEGIELFVRVLDERGAPLGRVRVRLSGPGAPYLWRISDNDGEVRFRRLPPGDFELYAQHSGHRARRERVELRGEWRDERFELRLAPLSLLGVDVRTPGGESYLEAVEKLETEAQRSSARSILAIATTYEPAEVLPIELHGSERDAPGEPRTGFGIGHWVAVPGPDHRVGSLRLDASGDFFVSLVAGQWVFATERVPLGAKSVSFELDPGTVLAACARVRGRLVDPSGAPMAGVHVGVDGRYSSWLQSGADGEFELGELMESTVTLSIHNSVHLLPVLRLQPGVVLDLGDVVFGMPANSDFMDWTLGSAESGTGGPLDIRSWLPPEGTELPIGYGAAILHVEEANSGGPMTQCRLIRVGPDGRATHPAMQAGQALQNGLNWISPLVPGSYAAGPAWRGSSSSLSARLVPFEISEGETIEVTLRLEPSGQLVLLPTGTASIGTSYRVRDEATGLVNRDGLIESDEPISMVLQRGPWTLELDLPDGSRRIDAVVVSEEPRLFPLPL